MLGFVNSEIESLVTQAFGSELKAGAIKLAGKILSNELDDDLLPLRTVLRLSQSEFSDGIFSWRGFLYFKWRADDLRERLRDVMAGLAGYQPMGSVDTSLRDYINEVRPRLAKAIVTSIARVNETLCVYDVAYQALCHNHNPGPFRRFLLNGPELFFELGESIGILSHIQTFWQYRIGTRSIRDRLSSEEYCEILMNFEDSLAALYVDSPATMAASEFGLTV